MLEVGEGLVGPSQFRSSKGKPQELTVIGLDTRLFCSLFRTLPGAAPSGNLRLTPLAPGERVTASLSSRVKNRVMLASPIVRCTCRTAPWAESQGQGRPCLACRGRNVPVGSRQKRRERFWTAEGWPEGRATWR